MENEIIFESLEAALAAGAELKEKAQEVYAEPSGVVYTGDIYTYEGYSFAAAPFDEDPRKVVFSRCKHEPGEAAGEAFTWREIGQ